jgi:ABC-2 type transport system ATP-binding protein
LGLDPFRDVAALQRRIGVQLQEAQLQKRVKVREAIGLWASLYGTRTDGARLLDQLGLAGKANAWFMTLSGGQKQRLFIALALIHDPELVFLDELTTGLDPQARRAIWDLVRGIRDRGKTVFLTTHLMEEAERLCDRVAIIDHGCIVDVDSPARLVRRHCPERTIVIETTDGCAADALGRVAGVESAASDGSAITLRARSVDVMTGVIRCLADRQIAVTDFRTFVPTLEDVFLKLTGHSVRQ